jgi:hypothetical protein
MRHLFLSGLLLAGGCGLFDKHDPHTFRVSWRLVDASQGNADTAPAITCERAGAVTVALTLIKGTDRTNYEYPCSPTGDRTTEPLEGGEYLIAFGVLDAQRQGLNSLTFRQSNQDGDADLGEVTVPLRPRP